MWLPHPPYGYRSETASRTASTAAGSAATGTAGAGPTSNRSWLIYVIGTNLSENHPALLMPSLFTNSPTYEDMITLSNLMGQAKPPVASESDVRSAGGLYVVVTSDGGQLVAQIKRGDARHGAESESEYGGDADADADGDLVMQVGEGEDAHTQTTHGSSGRGSRPATALPARIPLALEDRCLVCLSEYEVGEEVRCLSACKHIFHQPCIDQWLTTGRNSCPMCRQQGVAQNPAARARRGSGAGSPPTVPPAAA
ncbi:hypothetical protein KEM52_006123 [Ascosphaera acerosa]|nr:hypothetical protein KEM52_006123 [Ascosphaera acerosa]